MIFPKSIFYRCFYSMASYLNNINIKEVKAKKIEKEDPPYTFYLDFKILNTLGKGSQGTVYKVQRNSDKKIFAIKEIEVYSNMEFQMADRESCTFKKLNMAMKHGKNQDGHKHILKYEAAWSESKMKKYYILMELCEGENLKTWLKLNYNRKPGMSLAVFKQIVEGVNFMHRVNIVHRDLKPENIYISSGNSIKILDYGSAKKMFVPKHWRSEPEKEKHTLVGTKNYASPEVLDARHRYEAEKDPQKRRQIMYWYYDFTCDIYSMGLILAELLSPYTHRDEVREKAREGNFDAFSEHEQALLRKMLNIDPSERPKTEVILGHPLLDPNGNNPRPKSHHPNHSNHDDPNQDNPDHHDPKKDDPKHHDTKKHGTKHHNTKHHHLKHQDPKYYDPNHHDQKHLDQKHHDPNHRDLKHHNSKHHDPNDDTQRKNQNNPTTSNPQTKPHS